MKDRIFSVILVIVTLAFVAAFVLPWVARQRQIDAAILAKLEQISQQPPSTATQPALPENWSKLTVRLVRGEGNGPPVSGVRVTLTGQPFSSDVFTITQGEGRGQEVKRNERSLNETTGSDGRVVYGPILPGVYSLKVAAQDLQMTLSDSVTLYPAQQPERVIHYPDMSGPARVRFTITPADELKRLDADVKVVLYSAEAFRAPSGTWSSASSHRSFILDADGQIIGESSSSGSRSKDVPGAGRVSIDTYSATNSSKLEPDMVVAPVTWKVGLTAGLAILPESPEYQWWQYSAATQFTPSEPSASVQATAGTTMTLNIEVPPEVIRTLQEMKRRRAGVADVPAELIADPEWLALREASEQAARAAIQLARQQGRSGAAIEAYERARQAEDRLRERESAVLPQPTPPFARPRPPGRPQPAPPPQETELQQRERELQEALIGARENVQKLYLSLGPGDPGLAEAVEKMKELQRQLDELRKPATVPADAVPLPAKPHTGLPAPVGGRTRSRSE